MTPPLPAGPWTVLTRAISAANMLRCQSRLIGKFSQKNPASMTVAHLLPADVTTGIPALISCWAASLSAVLRGPPAQQTRPGAGRQAGRQGNGRVDVLQLGAPCRAVVPSKPIHSPSDMLTTPRQPLRFTCCTTHDMPAGGQQGGSWAQESGAQQWASTTIHTSRHALPVPAMMLE